VSIGLVGQAVGLFAVTNIDDIVLLALFLGQAAAGRGWWRVVAGQYLGFGAILVVAVAGALGAGLLPERAIPYLGLLPLALGLRAAWRAWREHRDGPADADDGPERRGDGPAMVTVAAATFANGGDNIGVYVPVFATTDLSGLLTYVATFLVLVGVWCAAGYFVAGRPGVAPLLSRWGHILLPVVLIALGCTILLGGL